MTPRQKAGCGLALITLFVRLPLMYAGTFLLYKHVDAPDVVWLIFWISLPVGLMLEVGSKLIENGIAGDE